jgi:polyhydroxybutyrate depolymerase
VNHRSASAGNWLIGAFATIALVLAGCGATATPQSPEATDRPSPAQPVSVADTKPGKPSPARGRLAGIRPAPIVHFPPNWSRARRAPLVIALHPSGGDPAKFEAKSAWDTVADEHGFIVAYLGSAAPAWKYTSNVAYIAAQIRRISAQYNVDPHRVYVTGFSAGAYISYFVGCRLSATVAAIAPVSGAMATQRCKLAHPVSELTIIGTHDIIPLSGTSRFPAPAKVTALWRRLDRCSSKATTVVVGPVTERTWESCAGGAAVGFYVIAGGRHEYPGSPGLATSDPDAQLRASEAVWAFFAAHRSRG